MHKYPGRFLHRDISLNNILLPLSAPTATVGDRGFLIDFDYAKSLPPFPPLDEKGQPSLGPALSFKNSMYSIKNANIPARQQHHDRTGTKPWMAVNVLKQIEMHCFKHDLESFFWVLYYLLALPTGKDQDPTYTRTVLADLGGMCNGSYDQVAMYKSAIIQAERLWINPVYSVIAGRMEELQGLFEGEIQRRKFKGPPELIPVLYPEFTYQRFLDILDKALHDLGDGGDVSRIPPLRLEDFEPIKPLHGSVGVNSGTSSAGSTQSRGEKRGIEDDPVSNIKRPKRDGKVLSDE